MQRMTFGRKNLNSHRPRVDRFVPPRDSFPEMRRRILWGAHASQHSHDDIWYSKYLQQKKYMKYLDDAFDLEPLPLQEPKEDPPEYVQSWPCVPRKKSYLSSADSILDLPTYSYAVFPEVLDWGNDNILVAALGKNYHKWSWHSQSLISQGITQFKIHCCKFDPRGDLLVLGTDMEVVEIHDNALNKWVDFAPCKCLKVDEKFCSITAVDWSPTANSFVIGCSRGMLVSVTRQSQVIRWHRVIRSAVLVVRVSPDARFVAAAAVNGMSVLILSWPSLELYSSLNSNWTIKTLTWHPWRSALLGIGSVSNSDMHARIALWDAPSAKTREVTLGRNPYSLDAMLFSKRTGELVLSLWNADRATSFPKSSSQLVVMSDPDTVVDQWGEGRTGLDRVRTMVFSPDGTKLATATADEDLIIWNFLPEDNVKSKVNCRRFSAIPSYLDEASYGVSLR